jgi:hypothetical protein
MLINEILNEDRRSERGKCLPETGYKEKYVVIYRAVVTTEMMLHSMDYVTRNQNWAIGHAQHVAVVEGENAHVLRVMVLAKDVYEAHNPGEYFYDGPEIKGRIIFVAEA